MPAGIPGEISRLHAATLEARNLGSSAIAYGAPAKIGADGSLAPLAAGDAAASVYGFLARSYPSQSAATDFGPGSAPANSLQSVMRRGYMTVTLKGATASAMNGQVYVRNAAEGSAAVGDIEAAAGDDLVAVAGCIFMGPADAGGNVEISYNI
jgi:hypothetical protein